MIPLTHFNQLPPDEAARLLEPCVAIDSWVTALVQARPYPDLATLHAVAQQTSLAWGEPELDLALSAHPRIGEKTRRPARACRAVAAGTGGGQRS